MYIVTTLRQVHILCIPFVNSNKIIIIITIVASVLLYPLISYSYYDKDYNT